LKFLTRASPAFAGSGAFLVAAALFCRPLAPGEVTEKVDCRETPGQSYAVYVPSSYTPERRFPVLYCLDARGRALIPIEPFRGAAEAHGWILVSSYDSRSDTQEDFNTPALKAMWKDANERLAIDPRRVYIAGFSGGGRAAVDIAIRAPGLIAGVIGCGAGFPDENAPVGKLPFAYFGTVGNRDFNYYEMRRLDEKLDDAKARHRIAFFDGAHEWPPAPLAEEALGWMDLEAMRSGASRRDEPAIAAMYARGLEEAKALESEGRPVDAATKYAQLVEDFSGLVDVAGAAGRADALRRSKPVKSGVREARRRDDRDQAIIRRLASELYGALRSSELPPPRQLAAQMGIPALRKQAATGEPDERLSAERILANLRAQTSFYLPEEFVARKDYARARFVLLVAAEIDPESPRVPYRLASVAARSGLSARAMEDLQRAVDAGFRDFGRLEGDPDFAALRDEPAFRQWLAGARGGAEAAPSPVPTP
jgi:predicted esterase